MNDSDKLPVDAGNDPSADPYRSPVATPDQAARRGLLHRPIAWVLAVGVLVGTTAAFSLARQHNDTGVVDYVEDFGDYRRAPPVEQSDAYEAPASSETSSPGAAVPVVPAP